MSGRVAPSFSGGGAEWCCATTFAEFWQAFNDDWTRRGNKAGSPTHIKRLRQFLIELNQDAEVTR